MSFHQWEEWTLQRHWSITTGKRSQNTKRIRTNWLMLDKLCPWFDLLWSGTVSNLHSQEREVLWVTGVQYVALFTAGSVWLRTRRRASKPPQLNCWAFFFFFFLPSCLGHSPTCAARFVHFYAIKRLLRNVARQSEDEIKLVLDTTTGSPPSSTFFIFLLFQSQSSLYLLLWSPDAEPQLWSTDTDLKQCLSSPSLLLTLFFCFGQEDEWRGRRGADFWVSPHPAYPCRLGEGNRLVEGLWRCRQWNTGRSCGALVPATAGSGRVGVWVLEVDSPMSCCMCRVLGVCLWHLFCCI